MLNTKYSQKQGSTFDEKGFSFALNDLFLFKKTGEKRNIKPITKKTIDKWKRWASK